MEWTPGTILLLIYYFLRPVLIVALGIIIIVFLIKLILKFDRKYIIIPIVCIALLIIMITAGRYRRTSIDLDDLCDNIELITELAAADTAAGRSFGNEDGPFAGNVWECLPGETEEIFDTYNSEKKKHPYLFKEGVSGDVRYYAAAMEASLEERMFYRFTSSYYGEIILEYRNAFYLLEYSVSTNEYDPLSVIYCVRPPRIKIGDHLKTVDLENANG